MKEIPLTQGKFAIVDDADYPELSKYKWQFNNGYVSRTFFPGRKSISMQNFLMNAKPGQEYDHKNRNKLDNRRENLRPCTRSQNQANRDIQSNNTSGYKGVYLHKPTGRYQVKIRFQGKSKSLGYYTDPVDAAQIYNDEAIKLFGEFARLNDIHQESEEE